MRATLPAIALAISSAASAQEDAAPMAAWEALEALPPRSAWDLAIQVDYTTLTWFHEAPWIGFGLRGGWGRLFGPYDRIGAAASLSVEGPVPLYYTVAVEPHATWDRVRGGLLLGASVGPSVLLHSILEDTGARRTPTLGPTAAVRVGYSERWSRAGRRFFAYVEPKARFMSQDASWIVDGSVALVVGSGRGL